MGIPLSMLPEIRSSSEVYGEVRERARCTACRSPAILGDQQAATFGQACLSAGEAKNTYGTGNFMLINTGTQKVPSKNGLLTTVCYKIGDQATVYALEGSIAVSGSAGTLTREANPVASSRSEIGGRDGLTRQRPGGPGQRHAALLQAVDVAAPP